MTLSTTITVVLAMAAGIHASGYDFPDATTCKGLEAGNYPISPDCSVQPFYYKCDGNGKATKEQCDRGFDVKKRVCADAPTEEGLCGTLKAACDGVWAGLRSYECASTYTVCTAQWDAKHINCDAGERWNSTSNLCQSRMAHCDKTYLPMANPFLSSSSKSCGPMPRAPSCLRSHFKCIDGKITKVKCTRPLVYDASTGHCNVREAIAQCK